MAVNLHHPSLERHLRRRRRHSLAGEYDADTSDAGDATGEYDAGQGDAFDDDGNRDDERGDDICDGIRAGGKKGIMIRAGWGCSALPAPALVISWNGGPRRASPPRSRVWALFAQQSPPPLVGPASQRE